MVAVEQDVVGGEVAVHDTCVVEIRDRRGQCRELGGAGGGRAPRVGTDEGGAQRRGRTLLEVDEAHDTGVVEPSEQIGLVAKPRSLIRIVPVFHGDQMVTGLADGDAGHRST